MKLLDKHGSLSAGALRKLRTAGLRAGLSPAEITATLNALQPTDPNRTPPVAPAGLPSGDAARPSAPSPSESFRRWIRQKLSGFPSSILSQDDEHGLVGVGVHRYHLAEVLATHIVRDVATDQHIRLERDLDGASCHSTVGATSEASSDDQRLKEFFEQVAPILSQHRGINAKSRLLLNAVAESLGLAEQELEQALLALQRLAADPNENDPRQLERRESFRSYLRRALAQLPDGIITFKTETRLVEAGEHFHGVTLPWIKPTINEVASEIGARFISKQQALDHISALVDDFLADKPRIDGTTRARIYTEGTRWGLDPMDIDGVLRDKQEALRRQAAIERRHARWVLNLSVAGSAIALLFLGWVLLPHVGVSEPSAETDTKSEMASRRQDPVDSNRRFGPAWWDEQLRVAAAQLRVIRPDLRKTLEQTASDQATQRQAAYGELVSHFARKLPNTTRQEEMEQCLATFYALEPSDLAAEELADALAKLIGTPESELPRQPEPVRAMFWGCRCTVAMLKDPATPIERSARLAEQLTTALGQTPDRLLEVSALQRHSCALLANRLYQQLTRLASETPDLASQLYIPLALEAEQYLPPATRDRLDVDFLTAVLPPVEQNWDRYAEVIRRVARATDPTTVIKLLEIYRGETDPRLQNYLAGQFLERLGARSESMTEQEMLDSLRQSLGVVSQENDHRRWRLLTTRAEELLGRKRVPRTNPDVLLQETIDLAHLATLACALTREEAGGTQFDELQSNGPVKLELRGGPWGTERPKMFDATYPVADRTVLRNSVHSLASSRLVAQRLELLKRIANQTTSIPDLDLPAGLKLAEYLVQFKPDESEHLEMLRFVPQLAKWNSVRLGLADQLLEVPGRDTQLQQLFTKVLDEDVDLNSTAGRASARQRLLRQVALGLAAQPDTSDPQLSVFDDGSKALHDLYAIQAKLLAVTVDDDPSPTLPSGMLAALIRQVSEGLSVTKLDAADQARVHELPARLRASEFAAENDLQYTAALQHIWLHTLALHVSQQWPEHRAAVREIQVAADEPPPEGASVFEQMRDQQIHLLRIWLLLRPAEDNTEFPDIRV